MFDSGHTCEVFQSYPRPPEPVCSATHTRPGREFDSDPVEASLVSSVSRPGANQDACFRHTAIHVDKLLKGAHAARLLVEQPTFFEMVVNLAAAKSIGLAVPRTVMLRADRTVG